MLKVADAIAQNGMDAWFQSQITDWITEDSDKYTMLFDTLDVWFDSGASFHSVVAHNNLSYPVDLYLEGVDQFRGWFQSSLKISLLMNDEVPL